MDAMVGVAGITIATQRPLVATAEHRGRVHDQRGRSRGRGREIRGGERRGPEIGPQHNEKRGRRRGGRAGQAGQRAGFEGYQHARSPNRSAAEIAPLKPPPPGLGGGGSFGDRLTEDAKISRGERGVGARGDVGGEGEAELCIICASLVVHHSVAPCNHRTCHICALRLRALYKTRSCAHCRTEANFIIFTDDPVRRYEEFQESNFEHTDHFLGIKYETKDIHDDTVLLLRYNCPDEECDVACFGWPDLHRHVRNIHQKVMCDLCTRNKKVFTHEHDFFSNQELRKHEKLGDDNPGAIDQSGFRGHPDCGFCRQRFYGDDELFTHCRDKHERCHICDRRSGGSRPQYFVDYNALELHFRNDHFLCSEKDCLEKKFVVFESEMDLKAHQLTTHPNSLSKDARKDARRVDMSGFDYRSSMNGRRERDGRSNGRGRDPNTEAIPQSTSQPLRRDELAYQRQMAIHSAQSVSTRTFGGQLTLSSTPAPRASNEPRNAAGTNNPSSAIDSVDREPSSQHLSAPSSPSLQQTLSPQEQARRVQHGAVMDRASSMLKNDLLKIGDFRARVSSYRTSATTATELIDTFFSLFDVSSTDLGKLVKELADIYESESKRVDLLKAWNDWRAINEDYPSLPGPSGVLPGSSLATTTSHSGRRILKLKSSTAQSSRSAASKQAKWGNTPVIHPFPTLPAGSANRAGPGQVGPTPWATSSSSSRPAVPASSRHTSAASVPRATSGTDAFPALPAAAKPNTAIFGLHRGAVRWDDSRAGASSNPWGNSNGTPADNAAASAGVSDVEGEQRTVMAEVGGAAAGGKKKGNKGKKQTLYHFG